MEATYWHKQADKPLFPDLLWSKPENKKQAGKLLIIGGNAHEFAAPAEAYNEVVKAGIGTAKVLLPEGLKKTVGSILENGEFASSTKTGSFDKKSLAEWLDFAGWADGVLVAGDLGRNSETAITLESFVEKYQGRLTLTKDAADYFTHQPLKLFQRELTTIVISLAQLQKLCNAAKWPIPITFSMTLTQLVETLHSLTTEYVCNIIVEHNGVIFVAVNGQVSTTPVVSTAVATTGQASHKDKEAYSWRVKTAAHAAVWWIQNPTTPFEALSSALVVSSEKA